MNKQLRMLSNPNTESIKKFRIQYNENHENSTDDLLDDINAEEYAERQQDLFAIDKLTDRDTAIQLDENKVHGSA